MNRTKLHTAASALCALLAITGLLWAAPGDMTLGTVKQSGETIKQVTLPAPEAGTVLQFTGNPAAPVSAIEPPVPYGPRALAEDPEDPEDGWMWYNTTDGKMRARIAGVTVDLGEGSVTPQPPNYPLLPVITSIATQTTTTPVAAFSMAAPYNAVRVWTGGTPAAEPYFDLYVRRGDSVTKLRANRYEARIIPVTPGTDFGFGTSDGRVIRVIAESAPEALTASFAASGTANCDKAGPPLWTPTAAHLTLPTAGAAWQIDSTGTADVVFVSESDGAVWSPPRWLRLPAAGGVRLKASRQLIALANYAGTSLTVRGPAGSVIGGESRTLHLEFPVVTGTVRNVSTVSGLKTAIAAAVAGDEIVLADGTYALDVNIGQATFAANHTVGGKRGMEGITIRGASGNRDNCIITCAGSGQGDWAIYHIASTGRAGFKDLTFDFAGSSTSGFFVSRGVWAFENVRWTGTTGSKDPVNVEGSSGGPSLYADFLRCQWDASANDGFNGNTGVAGDRVRLIDCRGFGAGTADSNQNLTTHNGLPVEDYAGQYGDAQLNTIAPDNNSRIYCFWTKTARTSRNAGILGVSGFGCDFGVSTAAGTGNLGIDVWMMASIARNTVRESTAGLARRFNGNLFQGTGISNVSAYYPSAVVTTEFDFNLLDTWNIGVRFDSGAAVDTWYSRYNTLRGCGVALSMTSTTATKYLRGNATSGSTSSITSSAGAMALTNSNFNVLDPTVHASYTAGANDVTGADAALDSRGFPTAAGNCDGTGEAAATDWVGGTDWEGYPQRLTLSVMDKGARCRPRIISGAALVPDIW